MRRATAAGRLFDFNGLPNERVIGFYAGFGGVVQPHFVAHRSIPLRVARIAWTLIGMSTSTYGG